MQQRERSTRVDRPRLALVGLCSVLVTSCAGSTCTSAYLEALGWSLLGGAVLAVLTVAVALPLGLLAASGPRAFDSLLRACSDLVAALPMLLIGAVLWAWAGASLRLILLLGALRGLELAWLVRCELVRSGSGRHSLPPLSDRVRLGPFLRRRLPVALGPVTASAAFSVAWLCGLDAALSLLGLRPARAPDSLGPALAGASGPASALVAVGSVVLITLGLSLALHRVRAPKVGSGVRNQ